MQQKLPHKRSHFLSAENGGSNYHPVALINTEVRVCQITFYAIVFLPALDKASERTAKRIEATAARATKLMIVSSLGEENGSALSDCQVTSPTKPSQVKLPTRIRGTRKARGGSKDRASRIAATWIECSPKKCPTRKSPATVLQPRKGKPGPPSETPTACAPAIP